jgi:RNA 2',3'-cyclic 3'-phosphodiesterase
LFVAIDLDQRAGEAIAALQRRMVAALVSGRSPTPVAPARMHVTLAFLGEIADCAAPPIVEALSAPIDVPRFAAELQGLGVFPPRGAPRILWLGVGEGAARIVEVQREVAGRLARIGVALEARPFHPHLTVARWKTSRLADRRRALAIDTHHPVARVAIDHVTLYHSRLSAAGLAYTAVTHATLT